MFPCVFNNPAETEQDVTTDGYVQLDRKPPQTLSVHTFSALQKYIKTIEHTNFCSIFFHFILISSHFLFFERNASLQSVFRHSPHTLQQLTRKNGYLYSTFTTKIKNTDLNWSIAFISTLYLLTHAHRAKHLCTFENIWPFGFLHKDSLIL